MQQDKIWDYFQTQHPESFDGARPRLRFLVNQAMKRTAGEKVLNIGVGNGLCEREAINLGLDIYSLDPSEKSIENLRKILNMGGKAKVGYSQEIPFENGYFGCVIISEVIEHLTPDIMHRSLAEIRRVLMEGGYIIGTVPAREDLNESLVLCPHCGEAFHRWGHTQSFTPSAMETILNSYFTNVHCVERQFMNWHLPRYPSIAKALVKDLCWRLGVRTAGESIYFIARKRK